MLSRLSNSFRSKCTVNVRPTIRDLTDPTTGDWQGWTYDCDPSQGEVPNPGSDRSREFNRFYHEVYRDVAARSNKFNVYGPNGQNCSEDEAKRAWRQDMQKYADEKKDSTWNFGVVLDSSQVQVATRGRGISDENTPLLGNEHRG